MTHQPRLSELTIEEKLRMMEALWDELSRNADHLVPPAWHGQQLEGREAAIQRGDEHFEAWEEAREQIEKEIRLAVRHLGQAACPL